jgi:xanthine dehydrogenase accessory factor
VAAAAGFEVRTGEATGPSEIPADTAAVVVASHGRGEEAVLEAAVRAGVPSVGLVASRRRGAAVLAGSALSDEERARVHVPAGLAIGATTPDEVAVSILAEIVQLRPRPAVAPPVPGTAGRAPAPATAVDPVCGMAVATVESSVHADVGGARVWFCGTGCRDAFLAEPACYGEASPAPPT